MILRYFNLDIASFMKRVSGLGRERRWPMEDTNSSYSMPGRKQQNRVQVSRQQPLLSKTANTKWKVVFSLSIC